MMRSFKPSLTSAFTLLEIMVVLVILSMILGIGMGVFSKVGSGSSLALARIKEVVRTARFHAMRERAPSLVRADPEASVIVGVGWRNVGVWHFEEIEEDEGKGISFGFPHQAMLADASIRDGGVIGNCLDFTLEEQPRSAAAYIPPIVSLDSVDGVSLECFVYVNRHGLDQTVLSKGEAYSLGINRDGRLTASLRLVKEDAPKDDAGATTSLEILDYTLPLKKWIPLSLQFNGYSLVVKAGGIMRYHESLPKRKRLVFHGGRRLELGGRADTCFDGLLDELRVSAAVLGEEVPFHESIQLLGESFTIHFDEKGFLDRDYHQGPVRIEFLHVERRRHAVVVGLMGEVR